MVDGVKMKKYLSIIGRILVGVMVLAGLVFVVINLGKMLKEYHNHTVKRVRISNRNWSVEKVTLENGKCFYVYVSNNRVFLTECENDNEH